MITKLIKCKKLIFAIVVFILILFITTFVLGNTKPNEVHSTYYKTIEIQKGDTLWHIAQTYNTSHSDIRNYITEIQSFNNMTSDTLKIGHNIVLPIHK